MKKEDFLQQEIEHVLNNIGFIDQYKLLSYKNNNCDDLFKYENSEILLIAKKIGCNLKYSKSREFYIVEKESGIDFNFGFSIRFNSFDFGMYIKSDKSKIETSAPWDFIVKLMTEDKVDFPRVAFRNYKDIEEVLRGFFAIYDSIKKETINQLNK
jgi:hypothetical protein